MKNINIWENKMNYFNYFESIYLCRWLESTDFKKEINSTFIKK